MTFIIFNIYNKLLMDSIGIYWIPLKLNMLPFLISEVDKVIEKFIKLDRTSKKGNK